ncbi:MAG: RIP metalloprotease RseP [Flavobacteriales bacterium]|nr:RIP metalloprotease RseP [Flavobacteriales bacterium]
MDYVIQAVQFLLGISILVILHEFGHFIAAKAFKTRVEAFYLFFNPWFSLVKKKIGDTEYGIGWLPLGGYVKISGMIDESMDKEQMEKPAEPWEFRSKPTWQRLIIMLGGVIVNVIVAFFIYAMVLFTWGETYIPAQNATYGVYCDSVAQSIGFVNGDKIVALDGKPIDSETTYGQITVQLLLDDIKEVTVDRGGSRETVLIPADFAETVISNKVTKGLFVEECPFIVDSVSQDLPAFEAGILKGDEVVAINGNKISGLVNSLEYMGSEKNGELTLTLLRNGSEIEINVTPNEDGQIGVLRKTPLDYLTIATKEYGFFESIPAGFYKTGNVLKRYIDQFKLIFSKAGVKQLGGFGSISKLYGATWDWQNFWEKTALISVMLAVMNLLPIPALDGGHVMFLSYEMITGRKPHEKVMEYAQIAGMMLLLAFMLYANGMDVVRAWFSN